MVASLLPVSQPTWTIVLRSREAFVDWRNGLGYTTKLRWTVGPKYEVTARRVSGQELPAEVMDAIVADIQNAYACMAVSL